MDTFSVVLISVLVPAGFLLLVLSIAAFRCSQSSGSGDKAGGGSTVTSEDTLYSKTPVSVEETFFTDIPHKDEYDEPQHQVIPVLVRPEFRVEY